MAIQFTQKHIFLFTVKISSDPKGYFRELSRGMAREARNINIMKKDSDRSQQRPETLRNTGKMDMDSPDMLNLKNPDGFLSIS